VVKDHYGLVSWNRLRISAFESLRNWLPPEYPENRCPLPKLQLQQKELSRARALEFRSRTDTLRQQTMIEISARIVDDRKQLQAVEEELIKAEERKRLSRILAPIDGTVQQLETHHDRGDTHRRPTAYAHLENQRLREPQKLASFGESRKSLSFTETSTDLNRGRRAE
jgi:hypothetical protein